MFSSPNESHSLLSAIAIETKGKLDKLVLHVDRSHFLRRSTTNEDAFATAIVQGWDELVAMMEGVRELHLKIPNSSISVQSRAPGQGGKACSLKSGLGSSRNDGSWQVSECKIFLEKVVAFTGASITHLGFCTNSFDSVEKLYKMIHLHKDSLTHLELEVEISDRPQLSLQVAVQCQNLSSLRLCYYLVEHIEWDPTAWPMVFPSDAAISHLKEFEFCTDRDYLDLSSYPFLNWLGKDLESFKLSGITTRKVQLQSLEFIFSSNPALKVVKLDSVKIFRASDSFVSSPLRFTNLHSLELHSVSGYGLTMFSTAFMPVLESLSITECEEESTDRDADEQLCSVLRNCHLSLKSLKMDDYQDRPSTNSSTSDSDQVLLEFPRLEGLSLFFSSDIMTNLCRRFQFSSSRLRTLWIVSRDSRECDESDEIGSILQAIRFLDSSSMTIEAVFLSLYHGHLNLDQELNIQTEKIRAFPKMKSLKLNWESKAIVDYFSSSSFGELEVLSFYHHQSKTSQSYQEECLKRALSIVELNSASLKEINFRGLEKAIGYKPEVSSFKLPKLKVLRIEVTSPNLVQFFLDHSQGVCLSELTLHALPKSYSLDDLLRVILPMSKRLTILSLTGINFGQDEVRSSKEKFQASSFPILNSLSVTGENLNLVELLGQYQYPMLYELYASPARDDKMPEIQTLFQRNAPYTKFLRYSFRS